MTGIKSESATQQERPNFFSHYLLILSTSFLLSINGQRSLASDINNPITNSDTKLATPTLAQQSPQETPQPAAKFYIRQIRVIGSTVFNEKDFTPLVKEFEERELTLEQIRAVSDAVTQLYLNRNYLNSRAVSVTPQPDNTDGILVLRVIEGRLAKIDIRGTQRVNPSYIRSRIQLANTVPLNTVKLEDQLRLLRLDPLFKNIEASLRPTGEEGESLLVVTVQEAESFKSKLIIDNYSTLSVGGERVGLEVGYRNLTGLGDLLTGSYYRTFTGGSQVFNLSYQIPVNGMNGTLGLRVSPSRTKITELPFRDLNIEGEQELYEINYRQPLWRSPREEFALSLGFTHQSGQTFVGGGTFQFDGSRTSVIRFGQEYLNRDPQGVWFGRSQFNLGVGLFNATISQDPVPDGRFFSWTGQLQRSQRLNNNHLLLIQADWQFTLNSLLASQQFVIGGGQSVRGYRQNIRSGDYGVRFAVEDRITIQRNESGLPMIQIAPFLDLGVVWNQSGNPNTSPDQKLLLSTGLGFLWNQALGIDNLSMRLDYAIPFVDLKDRGNNVQDQGFHFSLRYQP